MVVDYLRIMDVSVGEAKTESPLVVDPDAVRARTVAPKGFKPIPGRHSQKIKRRGGIQLGELALSDSFEAGKTPHSIAIGKPLRILAAKASNHDGRYIAYRYTGNKSSGRMVDPSSPKGQESTKSGQLQNPVAGSAPAHRLRRSRGVAPQRSRPSGGFAGTHPPGPRSPPPSRAPPDPSTFPNRSKAPSPRQGTDSTAAGRQSGARTTGSRSPSKGIHSTRASLRRTFDSRQPGAASPASGTVHT